LVRRFLPLLQEEAALKKAKDAAAGKGGLVKAKVGKK